jgi:hypothetical protein
MKSRSAKVFGAAIALMCLVATTVNAGLQHESGYLDGVNKYGCLTYCLGSDACFIGYVNTYTGSIIGTGSANVTNCSGRPQFYLNSCFGYICGVNVSGSLYTVTTGGYGNLWFAGTLCSQN